MDLKINFYSYPILFCIAKKKTIPIAIGTRLIFRSLKTTQTPLPADSKPLRLCHVILLVELVLVKNTISSKTPQNQRLGIPHSKPRQRP